MPPVSRSDTILNNNTLKQSFHIVPYQEWAGLNLASLETEQDGVRSGDWRHDWPNVLKRPRPRDRDKLPLAAAAV